MKSKLSEAQVTRIMQHLLERFGEPIGDVIGPDLEGVHDEPRGKPNRSKKAKPNSNRGFGARFEGRVVEAQVCEQCSGMMGMDGDACTGCGQMAPALEPPSLSAATIVVKGGPKGGGPTPTASNPARGQVASGVHPPLRMDGIPEMGSGRGAGGIASKKIAPPTAPQPMPAELPMNDVEHPPTTPAKAAVLDQETELDEKAPPGREKQVKALKKKKGIKNPWAVAWNSYNKSHGK